MPTDGMCIASLVMGVGAFLVCPLVFAVLAVIFGYLGRRNVEESRGSLEGEGLALAGIILGWINIAIILLFVIVTVIVVVI